jgi:hypothetical protein
MLVDGLRVGLDDVGLREGTAVGMLVDGLRVGLDDVGLLEGTAVGMLVEGLRVGLDDVGLLEGTAGNTSTVIQIHITYGLAPNNASSTLSVLPRRSGAWLAWLESSWELGHWDWVLD